MSIGFGGKGRLVIQDKHTALYEYAPYNLNKPEYRNANCIHDGLITISKDYLVEPIIHEKIKRIPGRRKKIIVKRIHREIDYGALINESKIIVENSQYCWRTSENEVDIVAMKIIRKIYEHYQETGVLPETIEVFV